MLDYLRSVNPSAPQKKRRVLTMANPLFVEDARLTETPPLRLSVCHHTAISSSTAQQGIHQDLQTTGGGVSILKSRGWDL